METLQSLFKKRNYAYSYKIKLLKKLTKLKENELCIKSDIYLEDNKISKFDKEINIRKKEL